MDEDLTRFLEARFLKIENNIMQLDNKIMQVENNIMERVGGRLDAVEERLREFVARSDHDLETKVITEFHKWGRTSDMRTRQAITDAGILGERMLAVEDRISALERERGGS
jgi:hypothetical protein